MPRRGSGRDDGVDQGGGHLARQPGAVVPRGLLDAIAGTTAMKRAAEPAEIAEIAAFPTSPEAGHGTGATVAVAGGRTATWSRLP
ncbi:hypothetical protein ACIGXM_20615 [Kitasatospora sp. NPDC052896]|uniref:hypothetical protein n=1 Tax=Kitasatospora sp. NPDC052896 TaxID=3364061 RepID=UPI0037C5AA58